MALSQKITPAGMTHAEYLDHLYNTVTREATIEREVNGRFKKLSQKVNGAEPGEKPRAAVRDDQVKKRPTGPVSFQQAAKDAAAGIVYDDDDD